MCLTLWLDIFDLTGEQNSTLTFDLNYQVCVKMPALVPAEKAPGASVVCTSNNHMLCCITGRAVKTETGPVRAETDKPDKIIKFLPWVS